MLTVDIVLYALLAFYLDNVIPSEYPVKVITYFHTSLFVIEPQPQILTYKFFLSRVSNRQR